MADLKLRKGDRVLVEMTVERPTPDKDGDIYGRVYGNDVWLPLEHIHSKLYTPIDEPQTIGSVVVDSDGIRYIRYSEDVFTSIPWIRESGGFDPWGGIHEPELVK